MTSATRTVLALLCGLAAFAGAAPAGAQALVTPGSAVADAAQAIAGGETVYVDPGARDRLSAEEANKVAGRISDEGNHIYVAVLPAGTEGTSLARQIGERARRPGTYVAVAGDTWTAASTDLAPGSATRFVHAAAQGRAGDTAAVLDAFVAKVASAEPRGGNGKGSGNGGGGSSATGLVAILAVLAGGGGLLAWRARRRRRREDEQQLAELRHTAGEDLAALGDDVRRLELDVEMPGADPRAKDRYNEAVEAYSRAEEALDLARRPEDFQPIGQALEEGRWEMEAAKARLARRPEPERRPPCFFDPRHGPSVTDTEWRPAWGAPRMVPVCAADAARLQAGEEPESREVVVGGQRMPYWQAPGVYAPFYAGGMFGGFGGFLPGLLFGSMLGGGFGFGGDIAGPGDWGSGDWGGGGDFGGGDFGGGDFGGGDFGGGDFGGGDFG